MMKMMEINKLQNVLKRNVVRGFSLPEVAIAIGIAGLALLSLVGLIPALSDVDRGNGLNSLVPQMTTRAMAELRGMDIPNLTGTPWKLALFFSESGDLVEGSGDTVLDRVFRCDVEVREIESQVEAGTVNAAVDGGVPLVKGKTSLVTLKFSLDAEPQGNTQMVYAGLRR